MLRVLSNIVISQQPTADYPGRKNVLTFNFCHSYECSDGWKDLTNKGRIILPKNIYVKDANGKHISLGSYYGKPVNNINIGGFSTGVPLLLRGDQITIEHGYRYYNNAGAEVTKTKQIFSGFVSNVTSKKPIEFEVEDNMWKLKQIPSPIHTFKKTDTLESILAMLLKGTGFTINALTQTTFGVFTTGHETVAETLARLKKLYNFESYFRGNELRCGSFVYIESEAATQLFSFQQNIIEDDLEYRRKDDIVLSAVAHNTIDEETGKITKDGYAKTKKVRLEVLITLKSDGTVTQYIKTKGNDYPPNTGGERRTFFFPGAKTNADLVTLATAELKKYYYTGYKGKFKTFGLPFVKQGDNAKIIDPILPERNGTYKIKEVEYSGGVDGLRQTVHLDYKIV